MTMTVHAFKTEADWRAFRGTGIGASEIAAALGASHYQTPLQLFASKLGLRVNEANPRMRWGHLMEDVACGVFDQMETACVGPPKVCDPYTIHAHDLHRWCYATPDAFGDWAGTPATIDFKIVSPYATEWKRDEAPREYQLQMQQQMLTTGREKGVLVALVFAHRMEPDAEDDEAWSMLRSQIGGMLEQMPAQLVATALGVQEIHVRPFEADAELQAAIVVEGAAFWKRVEQARKRIAAGEDRLAVFHDLAPPAMAADTQSLSSIYKGERSAAAIVLPRALADRLRETHALKGESARAFEATKAQVQRRMGTATTAVDEDGVEVATWSGGDRRVFKTVTL